MGKGFDVSARSSHRTQLFSEAGQRSRLEFGWEGVRQFSSNGFFDRGDHLGKSLSHEKPIGIFKSRRNAKLADDLGKLLVRQHLAVRNHTVEVENQPSVTHSPLLSGLSSPGLTRGRGGNLVVDPWLAF